MAVSGKPNGQQVETRSYFRRAAEDWRAKSESPGADVDVIGQRNGFVLDLAGRLGSVGDFLDLGCGTGELAIEMAAGGARSVGVDFADEMVTLAIDKARRQGATDCVFHCRSVFDFDGGSGAFDLISGLGLIEYMSLNETERLLDLCRGWLRPGGHIVLGSRNRLFNVFSLNSYTQTELDLGTVAALVEEATSISTAADMESCLLALRRRETKLPAFESHAFTGIGVQTRHQYTPAELVRLLEVHGFVAAELSPIHFHGLSPRLKTAHPDLHKSFAEGLHPSIVGTHFAVPMSSSFMIAARKP
jgi:2-polyprenyl-3-methyl-5-hydroxy-6-metoxy-1,4-benzoquinol methylase